jgi:hypothetical protein
VGVGLRAPVAMAIDMVQWLSRAGSLKDLDPDCWKLWLGLGVIGECVDRGVDIWGRTIGVQKGSETSGEGRLQWKKRGEIVAR